MSTISIPGLRGTITQRGKDSYRLQLSLGRNAEGKYDVKRETVRGTKQDAINLLTQWNALYLDNALTPTNYETVRQAYDQWISHIKDYRTPNTHRFYRQRFEDDLLPELGAKRLKDLTLVQMQRALAKNPANDRHNKRALRAFLNWCADRNKCPRFDFLKLETRSRPKERTEEDVWDLEQVRKVYSCLTFENLYDIFIVLGVERGLRPGEILALSWDKIRKDHILIDEAVKNRTPEGYIIGSTKTEKLRRVPASSFMIQALAKHKERQDKRINKTKGYNTEAALVVADKRGNVPDLSYVRKYMRTIAAKACVNYIPPKNLRSTCISLMASLGIPLQVIQQLVGHASMSTTADHYVRTYTDDVHSATDLLDTNLHRNGQLTWATKADLPTFTQMAP